MRSKRTEANLATTTLTDLFGGGVMLPLGFTRNRENYLAERILACSSTVALVTILDHTPGLPGLGIT
eukprot:11165667-Lingulodinium_polyedra.AAC.1